MKVMRSYKKIKLRHILSLLVISAMFLTASVGVYAAVRASSASLSSSYLQNNAQYAKKLASNTEELLDLMHSNLVSLAAVSWRNKINQNELDTWFQTNQRYFNSVFFADANRTIQAISPTNVGIGAGTKLTSSASGQAASERTAFISDPYVGASGRLLVLISTPVFDKDGEYEGFIGGTIYLQEDNVLSRQLSEHYYGNGSYVYVVDKHGRLIFHPNPIRINEFVKGNEVIERVKSGNSGYKTIENSDGQSYFAGYAYEPDSGWGIVSQTPKTILDEPIRTLEKSMILQALPLFILILIAALWISRQISSPLYKLARISEEAAVSSRHVLSVNTRLRGTYIYEVQQLAQSFDNYVKVLSDEAHLDGLTRLWNRKMFDLTIAEWIDEGTQFSLILLDVDHFKRINDTYGHVMGDRVLIELASQIRALAGVRDVAFRYGGEEYGVLVRTADVHLAELLAERIREEIAAAAFDPVGRLTVSVGVAHCSPEWGSAKEFIHRADMALYQSKAGGRNRTTVL